MNSAMWTYFFLLLGILGLFLINTFSQVLISDEQEYFLLKEITEASMYDSIDLDAYRNGLNERLADNKGIHCALGEPGTLRIIEEKFVESFIRRFADSAQQNKNYTIYISDIVECPPKVSITVKTAQSFKEFDFFTDDGIAETQITNRLTAILETQKKAEGTFNGDYEYTEERETVIEGTSTPSCRLELTGEKVSGKSYTYYDKVDVKVKDVKNADQFGLSSTNTKTLNNVNTMTVTNGTGVMEGKYSICCYVKNSTTGKEGSKCQLITIKEKTKRIDLNRTSMSLKKGENSKLDVNFYPPDIGDKTISWTSSNPSVASVDGNGNVQALAAGTATITATAVNGMTTNCTVEIQNEKIEPNGISIKNPEIILFTGETTVANVEISPANSTENSLRWSTNDKNVCTVKNGIITAKNSGDCIITVTTSNNKKATAQVYVKTSTTPVTDIKISTSNIKIEVGAKQKITPSFEPLNATNKTIKWETSDKKVATVDEKGNITAVGIGSCTITATADGGKKATVNIEVAEKVIQASSVSLNKTSVTLEIGNNEQLSTTISPNNTSNKTITWKSSNENVAKVDSSGKVTAISQGVAVITASTSNNKSTSCTISVSKNEIPVQSISLSDSSINLEIGQSKNITATINPSTATNQNITWQSSNNNVCTVDAQGKITAKAQGTTTITVKTSNNKTATLSITVTPKLSANEPQTIKLNKTAETVYINNKKEINLTAEVLPATAKNKDVTWSSSDKNVATVKNGVVTIKDIGTTTITAKTTNGIKATFTLTVKKKIIVETGASQSVRLQNAVQKCTYGSNSNLYEFSTTAPDAIDGTLVHVAKGGTGMNYIYENGNDGYNKIIKKILPLYKDKKEYVEFYFYFLITGNTIYHYSCSDISKSNESVTTAVDGYNALVTTIKNKGYNVVNAYLISMHPLQTADITSKNAVTNTSSNYCTAGYRSNWKYNKYNNAVIAYLNEKGYSNLTYVDTFNKIVNTSKATKEDRKYSYRIKNYKTCEGVHWDGDTARYYMNLMLNESSLTTNTVSCVGYNPLKDTVCNKK